MLAKLEDPRKDKGKRHPLKSILALVVIGLMCGHKGVYIYRNLSTHTTSTRKALGFTHKKTPCASTIHNLLKKLDVEVLEETLTKWILVNREQIALDTRYAAWRRYLICPMWCYPTSHGSFAKDSIIRIPICRDNTNS